MWKYTAVFLIVALAELTNCQLPLNIAKNDNGIKKTPLFVESLRKLHREPPEPPVKARDTITTEWIEQKLDHFDEQETRTWQMRYMVNDEHFKTGGPIFIMIGGEWEISSGWLTGGHFYDLAKEHNAMLYYTEHRYYGESRPTSDLSVENLKYLNVKQALADLAHFIRYKKENEPDLADAKVIMTGGSYAGTMVVWFKRLYPELLNGGWASSAPILAKVDFREYKVVVGQAMRELGSQQCYDRISNGIQELESMLANKRGAEVKAMMKLCNNFNEQNDLDLWTLFGTIASMFSGIVQYQEKDDVAVECDFLLNEFNDDATAIAAFLLTFSDSNCLDVSYNNTISYMRDTTYEFGDSRSWFYQTCNEYGWYQNSASNRQPFGKSFPLVLYTLMCADIFGEKYTNEQIHRFAALTNFNFGGMTPKVENIYMTHGGLDPWNPMGHGEKEGATVIPRASHCKDLRSIGINDSLEMRHSKEQIAILVSKWLKD